MFNLRRNLLASSYLSACVLSGFADYMAQATLDFSTGRAPAPALASRFLALFTTAPTSDAGTGGTEVSTSGTAYARLQIAGTVAATASWTTATPNITMTSNPGWVVAGMNVYDTTNSQQIGTVSTYSGTALVLTGNAAHASSGSTDNLVFSAFPAASASSGNEPSTLPASVTNGAALAFAAATGAGFGTVVAFGIYDASTSGNLIDWDYLGNFKWSPFTCTSASPGVLTCTDQSFTNGNSAVVSSKYGGTLPTTGGSWAGLLTVAGVSGSTFNLGVNTTGTGDGLVRQVGSQSVPAGVTLNFPASSLTLTLA